MKRIKKSYRFRLYPREDQIQLIEQTLGCCRKVYNDLLSYCDEEYKKDNNFKLNKYELIKMLPKYKEKYPYMKEVDSIALQQTVIHLYDSYIRFFKHLGGRPVFKKKKDDYGYISMNINNSIKLIGNEIQIPKLGKVRLFKHREIPSSFSFTQISVSRIGKHYYVALLGEEEIEENGNPLDINNCIGLDFSISSLFVTDSSFSVEVPKYYQESLDKLAKEQRKLSHMVKGSSHYQKQLLRLAKLNEHIANQRKDYLHKLSRNISNNYDYVFVEDLNLVKMSKKKDDLKLGKDISDLGYGNFLNYLSYKLDWQNKKLVKVDRYFPSSQLCSVCGFRKEDLTLSQRSWTCPSCGIKHNRDINASINIKKEGMRVVSNPSN